jgi:hypothetical protein
MAKVLWHNNSGTIVKVCNVNIFRSQYKVVQWATVETLENPNIVLVGAVPCTVILCHGYTERPTQCLQYNPWYYQPYRYVGAARRVSHEGGLG